MNRENIIKALLQNLMVINGINPNNMTNDQRQFLKGEWEKYKSYTDAKLEGMLIINC